MPGWFPKPGLFAIFINDLASEINFSNAGIDVNGDKLSLLVYADDIVLISSCPRGAQEQLDIMTW